MGEAVREGLTGTTVAIAGATGFVGRALVQRLAAAHRVVALGRRVPARVDPSNVEWRACDLFNLREAEQALEGAEVAVYLVHSMLPQARLTQAAFEDLDLICADNFARAARACGVKRIVYLGGLLPVRREALSRHLSSRHEVERTLAAHGVPVTTLRAGLIIGAGGSSFEMMAKLVRRLPVMVAPRWSRTLSQPIALQDVLPLLERAIEDPALAGSAYDIGGPDVLSYADMLRATGKVFGKKVRILTLPVRTANLSLLWVSVITGVSQALVRPLVESLDHDMVVSDGGRLQRLLGAAPRPLDASLEEALREEHARASVADAGVVGRSKATPARTVCSVQRLPLGHGRDARWVAEEYLRWLPRFLGRWFAAEVDEHNVCRFYFRPLRLPLLELTLVPDRSSPDRQLFFVTGGRLAGGGEGARARLEFRTALDGAVVLAAIHDFVPRLPWIIYRLSQGPVHLLVMKAFGRHLRRAALATEAAPP